VDGGVSRRRKQPLQDISVRPACAGDLAALLDIESAVFTTDRLDRRNFRHALRSPTMICLVACRADAVLGYVLVERRRTSPTARLTSIAVAPEAAGRGVGRRLLGAAEASATAAGSRTMRLEVHKGNAVARTLYEQDGYRPGATMEDYYENGAAAVRYEKTLAS
jgi:ribosomal protein S18 acetylase RimI-like enzyme